MVISALESHAGMSLDSAAIIADLSTFDGRLMTGSPCSTILSSMVIRRATERIHGLVQQRRGNFSVYVDDITISGGPHLKEIWEQCMEFLEDAGVSVHPAKKLKTSGTGFSKIITGVDVSGGIDATPEYRREVSELCKDVNNKFMAMGTIDASVLVKIRGKVQHLSLLNPGMAHRLMMKYRQWL